MANDLVVRLNGDSKGFEQSINSAKQSLQGLQQEGSKLDQFQQRFDKVVNSAKPMKKQLADLRSMLAEMNQEGLNTTSVFTQIAEHAGSLADNIGDAQSAVKAFANDNFNLQASAQAFQVVAAGGTLVTGAMAMMNVESEKATEVIAKVQGAIALLNGVQSISNLLNKDSALMLKLKQIQMRINTAQTQKATSAEVANNVAKATGKAQTTGSTVATTANTTAKVANTTATTANTVAQNAWNVATAIGKALFGDFTGLALVAAAGLTTYALATSGSTDKTNEQTKAVKTQNEALERQKSLLKNYADSVGTNLGVVVASFKSLQNQWSQMSDTAEKTQWIKDNTNEFNKLGLSIKTINDAENAFVKNSAKMLKAFELRAKAAAAEDIYTEAYKEYLKSKMNLQNKFNAGDDPNTLKINGVSPISDWFDWVYQNNKNPENTSTERWKGLYTIDRYTNGKVEYKLTELGAALYNEYLGAVGAVGTKESEALNQAEQILKIAQQDLKDGIKELGLDTNNIDTKPTSPTTNKKNYNENSLKYAQEQQRKWQELNDEANQKDQEELNKIQTQLKYWSDEVKKREEIAKQWEEVNGYLAKLENDRKNLVDQRNALNPDQTDLIENYNNQIKEIDKQIQDTKFKLGIEVELTAGTIPYLQSELKKVQEQIDKITLTTPKKEVDDLIKKEEEIKNQINAIQKLTDRTTHYTIEVEEEPETKIKGSKWDKRHSYQNAQSTISQLQEDVELKIIGADEAMLIIDQLNDKLKEIGLEPIEIKVENGQLLTAEQSAEKLIGFANSASTAMQSLGQSMQNLDEGGELAKAGLIASAIGQLVATFAGSFKGTWTVWEWIAGAAAGIATLTSVISQISKFEDGGIVGGSSYSGDRMLARVNSGEMILNKQQQSNLYNAISSGNLGSNMGGKVTFEIEGTKLKGVLNNYDRKMSKIK